MKSNKLLNKNFLFIVIGQIISLFGNGILRFILPLYLLQITSSSAIFGIVSAISFLPLILVMPIGGIIADRVNKRNIMIMLDFLTSILMVLFFILFDKVNIIILLIFTMMILYSINGLYQPAVQSSISVILDENILVKGNSIISSISFLSNLLSPIIAGFLFGIYGINSIIIISIICFLVSAILEIFIKIPNSNILEKQNILSILKTDISICINFIFKDKIILSKLILIACMLNAFISSLVIVALPVFITERLQFSSKIYGIATGILAFGGVFGGIITSIIKPQIEKLYKLLLIIILAIIPFLMAIIFISFKILSLSLILISVFSIMCIATIISILIMTYIQNNTPENIVGKVMAFFLTLSICSQPIGQIFYGIAFEYAIGYESFIILIVIIILIIISIYSKSFFKK